MTEVVTPFAEYGPVWVLVGVLLLGAGFVGRRLLEQNQQVVDAQVGALHATQSKYDELETNGKMTAVECASANLKLDAQSRAMNSAMGLARSLIPNENHEAIRHLDQMESQLRSDLKHFK